MNIFPQGTPVAVSFATSGAHTIVPIVAGKSVQVFSVVLSVAGATAVTFEDTDGTDLTGPMSLATGVPLVLPFSGVPWVTAAAGKGLGIASSNAVQVSGTITYLQL